MRYIDHPDHDLHPLAFMPEAGRMRLYGKSSPPPPPDYASAAEKTAEGNLEMARTSTRANRINQFTPYGSLTYKETAPDTWEQTTTLTPQAQATLDKQLALSDQYADVASIGFGKTRGLLENPELDVSQLPARAMNVGQTAQDAIMSRLGPQFQRQEEEMRTRLANQGITLGSDAYGREQQQFQQGRNDAMMQAALQGINLDQANRATALEEQAYLQDRPLNLINALRTGAQVQNPQFQQFAQQATTAGPNMLGAAQAQYGADMDAFNASEAASGGALGGLFSIGGAALGGMMGGVPGAQLGATIGGSAGRAFSDRRLKRNIKRIGTHPLGIGVYEFEYVWGGGKQIGVMAQEVEAVKPSAVTEINGFKAVDYGRL